MNSRIESVAIAGLAFTLTLSGLLGVRSLAQTGGGATGGSATQRDNLGNHTATTNLNMSGFAITNVTGIVAPGLPLTIEGMSDLDVIVQGLGDMVLRMNDLDIAASNGVTISAGTLAVQTTVASHLIPTSDCTYDLGSASNKWNEGFFCSNSVWIGTGQLGYDGVRITLNGAPLALLSDAGTYTDAQARAAVSNDTSVTRTTGNYTISGSRIHTGSITSSNVIRVLRGNGDIKIGDGGNGDLRIEGLSRLWSLNKSELRVTDIEGTLTVTTNAFFFDGLSVVTNGIYGGLAHDPIISMTGGQVGSGIFELMIGGYTNNDPFTPRIRLNENLGTGFMVLTNATDLYAMQATIHAGGFSGSINAGDIDSGTLSTNRYNALSDLGGGSGTTFLQRDGSWANPPVGDASGLIVPAQKGSAGTISAGQAVYLSGYDTGAGVVEVELADSDDPTKMPAFGVAREAITQVASGDVIVSGLLENQVTSGFSSGDQIWVDTNEGAFVSTKPTGPNVQIQKIGVVTRSHPTAGTIEIFGAGRANDVPSLTNGMAWVGDSTAVARQVDVVTQSEGDSNYINFTNLFEGSVQGAWDDLQLVHTTDSDTGPVTINGTSATYLNLEVTNLPGLGQRYMAVTVILTAQGSADRAGYQLEPYVSKDGAAYVLAGNPLYQDLTEFDTPGGLGAWVQFFSSLSPADTNISIRIYGAENEAGTVDVSNLRLYVFKVKNNGSAF